MASSSLSPAIEDGESRNWVDLPPELTSLILYRLGVIEILKTAQNVCKSWYRVCSDPLMWQKIDLSRHMHEISSFDCDRMCRQAVDRSEGGLVELKFLGLVTESLLKYIVDRSSNLRSLAMSLDMTSEGLVNAAGKLPLLEELEISHPRWLKLNLKAIGKACPQLKTLKLKTYIHSGIEDDDDDALQAIAASMPQLRNLQLFGNRITNLGLTAILGSCPHLEHLDLRQSFNINLLWDQRF